MKSYSDFTVVLPTLNEEGTIGKIIEYLLSNYRDIRVIVADDGSRDSTKKIVVGLSKRNKTVAFLDRHVQKLKRGLTASIVDGIVLCKTKYAIVMDADMQHPLDKVCDVAEKLVAGCDVAVAGRAEKPGWSLYRHLISIILIFIGKLVLFVERKETTRDIYTGFFGVDRKLFVEVFEKNRQRFVMDGYKVLFDFLKCVRKGTLRICDVPIVFNARKFGSSKAGMKQGIAAFRSFVS